MTLDSLDTPALLLEGAVVRRNTSVMRERMQQLGATIRPHLKTAKSARVAELATAGQPGGITVSTLKEAEYFLAHDYRDLLYAVGITPSKLARVRALEANGARMTIITDSVPVAVAIAQAAQGNDMAFRVLIEVDTGGQRAGVLPQAKELIEIAKVLHEAPGVELAGVLTHAGHSYHCNGLDAIKKVAREERNGVVEAAERLRENGLPCSVVSAGSTPTAVCASDLSGVTEMRPGVYVFYDLSQLGMGVCERKDIALSVLASVTGHNTHAGHLLVDAGGLALSKDRSANEYRVDVGFGEVCELETLAHFDGLFVKDVHQEHGIVPLPDPSWFECLPVGAKVRILPNHACMTAAAYDRYHVIESGLVAEEWDRVNGW